MNAPSSESNTTNAWDSYGNFRNNQTGLDVFIPWDSRQIFILATLSWIRIGIILASILANTFTLYLEVRHKLYLKSSYIFVMTLTTADWATSCGLALEWYGFARQAVPRYVAAIVVSSGMLSLLSATAVAFDRYLALHAIPLTYKQFVTAKKYGIAASFIMMLAVAIGCTLGFSFPYGHPVLSACSFLVGVVFTSVTMILYATLGCFLSRSLTKLQLPPKTKLRRLRQTRKILFTFFTIILTNVVLFLPAYLFIVYVALQPDHNQYNMYVNVLLANLFYTIQISNYILNPLIFTKQVLGRYLPQLCKGHRTKSGKRPARSDTVTEEGSGRWKANTEASVNSVSIRLKSLPSYK